MAEAEAQVAEVEAPEAEAWLVFGVCGFVEGLGFTLEAETSKKRFGATGAAWHRATK